MDLDQLLKKAKLSSIRLPKKLLQQRQEAQQDGEDGELGRIEAEIGDILHQQLYDQAMKMRKELDEFRITAGRSLCHSGIPDLPATTGLARSRIVLCVQCRQPVGLVADPKNIKPPVKASDFVSLYADRGVPAPFHPSANWEHCRCPFCNWRPWPRPDCILVSDGFLVLREPEKQDAKASTEEDKS